LGKAVYDYNYLRPHYKHSPETPSETYYEVNLKFNIEKKNSKIYEEPGKKQFRNRLYYLQNKQSR
jgi:hypothetical protein